MTLPDVLCLYSVILNGQPLWEYYSFLQKGRNEYFTSSDIIYMLLCQVIFLNHIFWDLFLQHPLPCFLYACMCTHTYLCSAFRALENSCIFKNCFFLSLSCVLLSSLKLLNISESQLIEVTLKFPLWDRKLKIYKKCPLNGCWAANDCYCKLCYQTQLLEHRRDLGTQKVKQICFFRGSLQNIPSFYTEFFIFI